MKQMRKKTMNKSEARSFRIIDSSTEGSFVYYFERHEAYFTKEWERRLGLQDLAPKDAADAFDRMVHLDDKPIRYKILSDAIRQSQSTMRQEFRVKTPADETLWILGQYQIEYGSDGKPVKYSGTHVDVTKEKEAANLLKIKSENKWRIVK